MSATVPDYINSVRPNEDSESSPPTFMTLPTEIRFLIYRNLLVVPDTLSLDKQKKNHCSNGPQTKHENGGCSLMPAADSSAGPKPSIVVLRACRRIHDEALSLLYEENRFMTNEIFKPEELASPNRIFDTVLSDRHLRMIKHLRLDIIGYRYQNMKHLRDRFECIARACPSLNSVALRIGVPTYMSNAEEILAYLKLQGLRIVST